MAFISFKFVRILQSTNWFIEDQAFSPFWFGSSPTPYLPLPSAPTMLDLVTHRKTETRDNLLMGEGVVGRAKSYDSEEPDPL